jgi:hypothetical protein
VPSWLSTLKKRGSMFFQNIENDIYETTWHHIPEDSSSHTHCCVLHPVACLISSAVGQFARIWKEGEKDTDWLCHKCSFFFFNGIILKTASIYLHMTFLLNC